MYDAGDDGWQGSILAGIDHQLITSTNGSYAVDFSLANTYTITIRDTNDSKTEISGFVVSPDTVTTTITTAPGYYADTFCTANPTDSINCPDGATRRATTLTQLPV
jgi:secreted PhoX family phosphatase